MPNLSRRDFIRWAAAAVVAGPAFLAACARGPKKKVINFFNWSGYVGKETLPKFEQETGIEVNYGIYYSEEEMFGKLESEADAYDLVVATGHMISKLKRLNLIVPLPQHRLKNMDNIGKDFRNPIFDPNLAYTVPYLWGTTGLGFNTAHFSNPPNSWQILWDEKYKGRISMLDNAYDAIECALLLLDLPADSKDPGHLRKVRDLLLRQRPLVKQYSTYVDDLSTGELWLAQDWSGDILRLSQENKSVDYVIPQEGSYLWHDNLCLSRVGSQKEEVLRFVDYLLRPDVAAEIANTVRYPTPNEKALPLLDPTLRKDTRAFPSQETKKRLRSPMLLDQQTDELWNRVWQEVRNA